MRCFVKICDKTVNFIRPFYPFYVNRILKNGKGKAKELKKKNKKTYTYIYIYRERERGRDTVSSMEIGPKTGDDKGIYRNVDGHALLVSWTFPNQFFDCLIYSSHFTSSAAI